MGTRLAVAEAGHGDVLGVHVYPLPAGGPGQAWTVASRIASDVWGASLSWSANDRVLAVGLAFGTVRLLDTAVPPGRAAAVEDITLGVKDGYQCYYPVLMTSDGSSLVCGVAAGYYYREAGGSIPGRGGFAVYDIRTGDLTAVLGAEGPGQPGGGRTPALIWASPRGTILFGQPLLGPVSLFRGGHYQPIAWTGVQQADQSASPMAPGLPGGVLRPGPRQHRRTAGKPAITPCQAVSPAGLPSQARLHQGPPDRRPRRPPSPGSPTTAPAGPARTAHTARQ